MGGRLFIALGVSRAKGLPHLPGVYRSVRDMCDWATDAGYDTVEVTDETAPVDVARIKAAIEAKLAPGLDRIILYFVGHGYSVPPEQYLILSAGPAVPDQRIARDGLRDMLATYGPRQISVITDACMVLASLKGLAVSVLDPDVGETPRQHFDGFFATQDDTQAYAFRATDADPELCLFSWVLHRALSFQDQAACDAYEARHGRRVVTSYSLGDYLDAVVPREAAARKVWQQPQTNTGFRPPDHVYSEVIAAAASSHDDDDDDASIAEDLDLMSEGADQDEAQVDAALTDGGLPAPAPRPPRPERRPAQPLEARVRSEWRRPFSGWAFQAATRTGAALVLDQLGGARPRLRLGREGSLQTVETPPFRRQQHRKAFVVPPPPWPQGGARTVLISTGQLHALAPLYRGLWSVCQLERGRGPIALAWGSYDEPPPPDELSALEVLKGLLLGRLSATDLPEIAAHMRIGKHRDPMKGIVAAYLYDGVGDVENNRRMCWHYRQMDQPAPFDVALLARARLVWDAGGLVAHVPATAPSDAAHGPAYTRQATPACQVAVAGHAPVLRAGWSKLALAGDHGVRLSRLADHLTENPIATFRGKTAADALADLISQP